MKKNTRNKRIVILALFILVVIIQILAFRLSTANKVIELNVIYNDENAKLESFNGSITATDKGNKGYLITLPDKINGLKVNKYYIEQAVVTSNQGNNENVEGIIQTNIEETNEYGLNEEIVINQGQDTYLNIENNLEGTTDLNTIIIKNPLEEVYVNKKNIENNSISINVEYDTQVKNDEILYNQEIETTVDDVKVIASGYMPSGSEVVATQISTADIVDTIQGSQKEKVNINFAYDIKIKVNEKEYEPEEFGNCVQINITGIKIKTEDTSKIVHIKEDNTIDEIKVIEKKNDEVTFKADSFSVYALVSEQLDQEELTAIGASWNGTIANNFKYGEGTKSFPYLITSGEELAYLASQVNNGQSYEGIYFELTEDLNLNNISWTPIGTTTASFRGIFDGAGHTISNVSIAITSASNSVESYGVFGSIGGGNTYSEIKNVEFSGIDIDLAATRTISNNTYGYKIGIVTGVMYNHSKIANVIINSSNISDSGTITLRTTQPIIFIGGITGDAVNSSSNTADPGDGSRYNIENCYANVNFDLDIQSRYGYIDYLGQYNVGGIIGRIKSQPVWPTACLYKGSIDATNAFTGPIFGAVVNNTSYATTSNYNTLWNGNDAGSLTMTSYYTSYSTNSSIFTSTVTSGNTASSATYRRSTSTNSIAYVQGVNKGIYLTNESSMLSNFNTYATGDEYSSWTYSNSKYSLDEKLVASVTETESGVFVATATSKLSNPNYTYKWYIDGSNEISSETNTITVEHELTKDHTAILLISDGSNYTTVTVNIKRYTLYFEFTYSQTLKNLTATYAGTYAETKYFDATKYTLQWYSTDLTDIELIKTEIVDAHTLKLTNVDLTLDYILVGTNTENTEFSLEGTYTNKNVIYLDYAGTYAGTDTNDGLTTTTPVKTFASAYGKLTTSYEKERNIIVVMSNYTGTEFLNSQNSTSYNKPATIVGAYNGENYNSYIYFQAYSTYKYLVEDTKFKNITFNGQGSQTYLYAQGYDLTMDEGVKMTNYANSNTNQGLITGTSPAFHIFGGWYRYNYANLPRNNNTIIIKSGTYGRIIAGGSPGSIGSSSVITASTTSHNFTGSSLTDIYTTKLDINIENSTTDFNTYTYDTNLIVGGSAWGNTYANVTENIYEGIIGRILGGSIGDSSTLASNWNYPSNTFIGYTYVNMYGGSVREIYGGCLGRNMSALSGSNSNLCDAYFYGTININIQGGTVEDAIYGAGAGGVTGYNINSSDPNKKYGENVTTSVNINISGGNVNADIYGGGYGYTEYLTENSTTVDGGTLYGTSNISINNGANVKGDIYGAGRGYSLSSKPELAQTKGNTTVSIYGNPTITGNIYGAGAGISGYGDIAKLIGNSSININGPITNEVYGGGNIAKVNGDIRIYVNWGESQTATIYGGGNLGEIIGNTYVYVNGGTNNVIYGGGNLATVNGNTSVSVIGGTTTCIYGSGNQAGLTGTTLVEATGGNINQLFGGGNKAGAPDTNVKISGQAIVENAFGGSNESGTVEKTTVNANGGTIENIYGGGKIAETTTSNLNLISGTINNAYGGGQAANVTSNANINLQGANVTNVFGGSNESGTVNQSNVVLTSGTATNIYGGNDNGGTTSTSYITANGTSTVQNIYGGNNRGGNTITSNVSTILGNIDNVYGGGNQAETENTNVTIKSTINQNVYGGGNLAKVNSTNVIIENATIKNNIYGGGNEGKVDESTNVNVKSSNIKGSIYAGGNGTTATVKNSTNINVEGTTVVGDTSSKTPISGCVFGGGNAAPTGTETNNNSTATVNIVGATIYGNVYGGANTSVVYGNTKVNIGYEAVNNESLQADDIYVKGTVFGGGESNALGSETYDFSFISVTTGIDIHVNGSGKDDLKITGSIFGSGNASSTSGQSHVYLDNYGTIDIPQKNISLQRANVVTLNNSAVSLSGTTDRTNDYSDVIYTISRIDELKLKNGSMVYLDCGANLLKKVSSLADTNGIEAKEIVNIGEDSKTLEQNVDNRIYMYQGQNLNIATNQQASSYGDVEGMMFFGLYTNKTNPSGSTGIYDHTYENKDKIINSGTFSYNSYVKAAHKTDHDTTADGFYSNYDNNGYIQAKYIEVTPKDDIYYIWLAGENLDVTVFAFPLTASKYTTLGTYELSLTGFSKPNTKMILTGFSSGLEENVILNKKADIPTVANTSEEANENYALTMKTGNNGWTTNSTSEFVTYDTSTYSGDTSYNADNSAYTPSLLFYLYHSQNLSEERELGTVTIRLQVLTPIDDLNDKISYIDVVITMKEALHQGYAYEASITPGEEFSLFTTTPTNITTTSKFSTYYSLYEESFSTSDYYRDYLTDKRVLVSTRNLEKDPFVYPENTKITMIDMHTNEFYYYVVTADDEANGKYIYKLSDFVAMGSTNKLYQEQEMSQKYYSAEKDIISEEFIFQVDFAQSNINENSTNNYLLMEMRDIDNQTLIGVLNINRDTNIYGLYQNTDATINVQAEVTNENKTVYLGNTINVNVATSFDQRIVDSSTVYDTQYFNNKMGIKLTIYDNNGNQLSGDTLLGIKFILNGYTYYPRTDGTVRINVAQRVANVLSKIKIDTTENNVLATGTYTIKVESFGSPDGIYYGTHSSSTTSVDVTIINLVYGLDLTINSESIIIDGKTGLIQDKNNILKTIVTYSSGLKNPNLTVCLNRRDYSTIYSQNYEMVDLQDYILTTLAKAKNEKEYIAFGDPSSSNIFNLLLKSNLKTGTYKLTYKLYDGINYIGEDSEYIIIK